MGVKLTLEIEGPLGSDDANILGGIAMVFLALAQSNSPDEEATEEEPSDMQKVADEWFAANGQPDIPQPCGKVDEETGKICAGLVGHRGRHLFRTMPGMPGVH